MRIETVAVVAPGDMGHAVADVLRQGGLRVVTCLAGRGPDSVARAARAGMVSLPDMDQVVREADIFLSILPPSGAVALAEAAAASLRKVGGEMLFVDCNAVSPETVCRIGAVMTAAGARFVDGGIIGSPPKPGETRTRLYVSGADAPDVVLLQNHGLEVHLVGPEVGQASALKMCYSAMTKGFTALATETLTAARALGVQDAFDAELKRSRQEMLAWISNSIPRMPPKAYRWIGEMEEIAATFNALGLTPRMLLGAADLYGLVGESPLGRERTEHRSQGQTVDDVARVLAGTLQ
jgi:3-hydroxyisobutyrate dehydrogenase-like beta-hydroxyacid dehydrogenase